jgi:hypothetical protein
MNVPSLTPGTTPAVSYHDAIVRAASDPAFDIEKLERLIALQEAKEIRAADLLFNEALSRVQAECGTVSRDAANPQTRSRYATYAALDREVRPIYTRHAFSVSYTTEPGIDANTIMVVGMLTNGPISRRYQLPVPIDTKGPKGSDHMTRTHATMAATSYGKRGILTMMFNLATDDDAAPTGGKPPPRGQTPVQPAVSKPPPVPEDHLAVDVDEKTGEDKIKVTPFTVDWLGADTARSWGEKLMACLREYCSSAADVDGFINLNQQPLDTIRAAAPSTYRLLQSSIDDVRNTYQQRGS